MRRTTSARSPDGARSWWALRSAITSVGLLIPQVVVAVVLPTYTSLMILTGVATVVVGVAHVLVVPRWRYALHRWEITDDAVYTAAGWLRQEWRIAPMSRIQTVDTVRGPLQQLFDLSSVTVTTASAAGPLTIDGVDRERATEVVEQLTATTQATPGDAT